MHRMFVQIAKSLSVVTVLFQVGKGQAKTKAHSDYEADREYHGSKCDGVNLPRLVVVVVVSMNKSAS